MTLPRSLTTLFSLWGIAGTASTGFSSLRTGRRDGNRVLVLHGLANLLVAATTAAVFVHQRRKDSRT
ncbi:MAG: hypothetical protein ABR608_16040 [Pseudonocardiaceae bacterium]